MDDKAMAGKVMAFLNGHDNFCRHNDIRLVSVGEDRAEAVLDVRDYHLNSKGMVQGGAIFTLADLAFAGVANSDNRGCVSFSSSVNFIRPGGGSRLRAVAERVHRGSRTGLFEIRVYDDSDRLVALVTMTGFATGAGVVPEE